MARLLTPMAWPSTEPSLMLASSSASGKAGAALFRVRNRYIPSHGTQDAACPDRAKAVASGSRKA